MKSIYAYADYRIYLKEYYDEKKRVTRNFSYRYFSSKAGIKSPVFLKLVIDGKRNLTEVMIRRFITALELSKKQSDFFRHLVLFNQAKTAEQKQEHYRVCKSMQGLVNEHVVTNDQYDYFNNWYTSVVREIICLYNFNDEYAQIGQCIIPPITAAQVKKSIDLLLRLKMIAKGKDGMYRQIHRAITTGSEVTAVAVRSFNRSMLEKAISALDHFTPSQRYVTSQTLGVSATAYDVIVQEIQEFQERITAIVNQDERSSKVCQLCVQLFPMSKSTAELHKGNEA